MAGLRVHLLGAFDVEGVDTRRFGSRKARTLFKLLALARGGPVPVDRAADCLWPEGGPAERPADAVSVLVSRLRAVVGAERLTRTDAGYSLDVDWLDVAELERRTDEAAALLAGGSAGAARAMATAAVSLARGELLAGEPDAFWAVAVREAAARAVARARLVCSDAALRAGDPLAAADLAGAVLDHDPYDEAALRLVMRAHCAAGRPGSALAAYARLRERLAEDLGAGPGPETEALHTAVLRDEHVEPELLGSPADTAGPRGDGPGLAGREPELAALDAVWAGGSSVRLVLVEGEPGIGKTALAQEWAGRRRQEGATVLAGRCDPLGRALLLQPVADALDGHLRALDPAAAAAVLGDSRDLLAPVLGFGTAGPGAGDTGSATAGVDPLADPSRSLAVVFEAVLGALIRCGGGRPTVLVIDDLQWAGTSTLEWLRFAQRRGAGRPVLMVATSRPEPGAAYAELEAAARLSLGPLDEAAVAAVVGPERAAELHARSGGHPLFMVELAAAPDGELPVSIRDAVTRRCAEAGEAAATTMRTAALLSGPVIDVDLLAAVLGQAPVALVDHLEAGVARGLLAETAAGFAFRHDLVAEALAAGVSATRRALVHREAAVALARRPDADPLAVAHHARLGGDRERESAALLRAAERALDRYDYGTADGLLTQALNRADSPAALLLRARVRLVLGLLDGAQDDAGAALAAGAGAEAMEVAAWIAYARREILRAERLATDGARLADGPAVRARCLTALGRARHALGEVGAAEEALNEAAAIAPGPERMAASVWLGAVLVHRGQREDALRLLGPATHRMPAQALSRAPLTAFMYAAYAHGMAGRPLDALALLGPLRDEIERRQEARFYGVPDNFRGWVLRNLGVFAEADDCNLAAVEAFPTQGEEANLQGQLDLAAGRLMVGDAGGLRSRLERVGREVAPTTKMVWRIDLRRRHLAGRLALLEEDWAAARGAAAELRALAVTHHAGRYEALAEALAAEAGLRAGDGADLAAADLAVRALPGLAGLEAWWVIAALAAAAVAHPEVAARWSDAAERQATVLARAAGEHGDALRRAAADRVRLP